MNTPIKALLFFFLPAFLAPIGTGIVAIDLNWKGVIALLIAGVVAGLTALKAVYSVTAETAHNEKVFAARHEALRPK